MLSDEPLCQFGVAVLQRLNDAHVIGNRAGRAIVASLAATLSSAAQTSMISMISFLIFLTMKGAGPTVDFGLLTKYGTGF